MTTDINELVKRLRDGWSGSLRHAAADALEAMAGERDKTRADYEAMKAHNKELFGKLSAAELERDRLAGEVETAKSQFKALQMVTSKEHEDTRAERDRLKAALEETLRTMPEGSRVHVRLTKALGGDAS